MSAGDGLPVVSRWAGTEEARAVTVAHGTQTRGPKRVRFVLPGRAGARRKDSACARGDKPLCLGLTSLVVVADQCLGLEACSSGEIEGAVVDNRTVVHCELPQGRSIVGCGLG